MSTYASRGPDRVVTYRAAYVPQTIELCAGCARLVEAREHPRQGDIPVLGPVDHGEHAGWCDGCDMAAEVADAEVTA